jgi:hypothetical protein
MKRIHQGFSRHFQPMELAKPKNSGQAFASQGLPVYLSTTMSVYHVSPEQGGLSRQSLSSPG